jgi:hypothetical protein
MVGLAELNGPEPPPVLVEVRRQHNRAVSPEAGQTRAPNAARRAERDYLYPNPACTLRNPDTALYSCQTSLLRTWAVLSSNGTELSANEASSPPRPSMRVRRFKEGGSFSAECRSRNSAILRGLTRHWLPDVSATAGVAHSRLAHCGARLRGSRPGRPAIGNLQPATSRSGSGPPAAFPVAKKPEQLTRALRSAGPVPARAHHRCHPASCTTQASASPAATSAACAKPGRNHPEQQPISPRDGDFAWSPPGHPLGRWAGTHLSPFPNLTSASPDASPQSLEMDILLAS